MQRWRQTLIPKEMNQIQGKFPLLFNLAETWSTGPLCDQSPLKISAKCCLPLPAGIRTCNHLKQEKIDIVPHFHGKNIIPDWCTNTIHRCQLLWSKSRDIGYKKQSIYLQTWLASRLGGWWPQEAGLSRTKQCTTSATTSGLNLRLQRIQVPLFYDLSSSIFKFSEHVFTNFSGRAEESVRTCSVHTVSNRFWILGYNMLPKLWILLQST